MCMWRAALSANEVALGEGDGVALPMPNLLLVLTIVVELGGALMIALGWHARWAALVLFLFLIPVSLVFHAFWKVAAELMQNQMNHFAKNLAIMGGMLYIVARGSGPY